MGTPDIDRRTLPGYDAQPKLQTMVIRAERIESLTWRVSGAETSQSPATQHASNVDPRTEVLGTDTLLRRLYETLELPGTLSDYHFAIMNTYLALWARRSDSPETFDVLEKLCLLDIRLAEVASETIPHDSDNRNRIFAVPAFEMIAGLYERNGFIEDALQVHRRGFALGQGDRDIPRLEERIREIHAEDGE